MYARITIVVELSELGDALHRKNPEALALELEGTTVNGLRWLTLVSTIRPAVIEVGTREELED